MLPEPANVTEMLVLRFLASSFKVKASKRACWTPAAKKVKSEQNLKNDGGRGGSCGHINNRIQCLRQRCRYHEDERVWSDVLKHAVWDLFS